MAARPRCAHCRKAFTPNYRNRSKIAGRQRVCASCGPAIGHRLADRRYRSNNAPPRKRSAVSGAQARVAPVSPVAAASPEPERHSPDSAAVPQLADQVGLHLAAIAALVGGARRSDGCEPFRPLPIGIPEKSRPAGVPLRA